MGEQRERRLISEWALARHPKDHVLFNVPIGEVLNEFIIKYGPARAVKASKPWRLEVDAVVVTRSELILAEAKIFQIRNAVADLLCYRPLVQSTPELREWKDLPLRMVVIIPWTSRVVEEMCSANGITVDVFAPEWLSAYIEEHGKYWTRPYQEARQERKILREALGI